MSHKPPRYQTFFADLKRRRVFRVAAVYGITAFAVLQAADLVFPRLGLPEWTVTLVVALTLLFFPIAIVIAWAFEVTPQGVRRTESAPSQELEAIAAQPPAKRWPSGLLALAGIVMLVVGGWLALSSRVRGGGEEAGGEAGSAARSAVGLTEGAGTAAGETEADERSIAVLPFENMSGDEESAAFTAGIHDDILTHLSKIRDLRVTSRTSVREYANTEKGIPEIAAELGVASILEGAVRRAGGRVRVNVQLIDAGRDQHLWAESYDRDFTPASVFAIQSEIARNVAEALEATLSPEEARRLVEVPTESPEALSWYHRGRALFDARSTAADAMRALEAFERAVALDPEYASAWADLARSRSWMTYLGGATGSGTPEEAVQRVEALAPGSPDALLARGYFEYYGRRDFARALEAFRGAERLLPSDADVLYAIGLILRRQGAWEEALAYHRKAVTLDPRNPTRLLILAEDYSFLRRWADAEKLLERVLILDPANAGARSGLVTLAVSRDGVTERARRMAGELRLDSQDPSALITLVELALMGRDFEAARRLLDAAPARELLVEDIWRLLRAGWLARVTGAAERATAYADTVGVGLSTLPEAGFRAWGRAVRHALRGERQSAVREALVSIRQVRESGDAVQGVVTLAFVAELLAWMDARDEVFPILADLASRPALAPTAAGLRLHPIWDPIRGDPRFEDAVRKFEAAEADGARVAQTAAP